MKSQQIIQIIKVLNALDVLGLAFLLLFAFVLQLSLHELPCPLCLLQRIGILGIAFGFLLNVKFAIHPGHYTLSLLAALLTAAISVRQIFLHVLPGAPGYGLPFLGLHLYTWVFLLCIAVIIYIAIVFSIFPQYSHVNTPPTSRILRILTQFAFGLVLFLAIFNGISTYIECGFNECPENPVGYTIH
jgi:disulfide bond formation protein DsbB